MYCDRLWYNARLATLAPHRAGLGVVDDGIVACRGGAIVYAGPRSAVVDEFESQESVDCGRRWITPGLIDCHTHLIYGGNRSTEFEQRRTGVSYEKIAQAGGGIASTVAATRAADDATLLRDAGRRLDAMLAEGVTTVEIKSGYGLTLEHERKQLRLARQLAAMRSAEITTTFLGLHACPPEYKNRSDDYVDLVCQSMLPALASEGLIDAVDAFCDTVGFTPAQVRKFFKAAARYRLPLKLHAEQLSNQHGAALAAEFSALSADHLEYLDEAGADALA
ncbi:MAG: amidohydrolase family protein, partial [Rhodospirillaceae bacterium]|nr:amidohydrolase family protein [Rhodospirillaceae bacterium]